MGVIDTTKDLAKLVQQIGNIEVYEKVLSLQGQIMELMSENMGLQDALRKAQAETQKLRDTSEVAQNLRFDDENYWLEREGKRDGPFCQVCWDIDSKLVRLRKYSKTSGYGFTCDYCGRARN